MCFGVRGRCASAERASAAPGGKSSGEKKRGILDEGYAAVGGMVRLCYDNVMDNVVMML